MVSSRICQKFRVKPQNKLCDTIHHAFLGELSGTKYAVNNVKYVR